MEFSNDWWYGGAYADRVDMAKGRCARGHFPDLNPDKAERNKAYTEFLRQLEARTILYLRDGFSYEVKELIQHPTTATLTFECMPADESYKVGCFVVTVPYEDIVRVEIFAVHPDEKPEDMPSIKGFGSAQGQPPTMSQRGDERSTRREKGEGSD